MNAWSLGAVLSVLAAAGAGAEPRRPATEARRPATFVSIADVDPTILVELRYLGSHNFLGRPVPGYRAERCLLTRAAALALARVQGDLRPYGLSLKVYDCYRPQRAVDAFVAWAKDPHDTAMQAEFYPRVRKDRLFRDGYIAERSGHSRGSTVDLTVVRAPARPVRGEQRGGGPLRDCTLPAEPRPGDGTLDLGTAYDCFDPLSRPESAGIPHEARVRRLLLRAVMEKHGFRPTATEWWHFTLAREPYPRTYFDFVVE
jgi:D-alanyl-D-alanine dipeptidase